MYIPLRGFHQRTLAVGEERITVLDLTKQANMLFLVSNYWNYYIQTSQTGDESYSDDSPYGECSLISRKKHSLLHYNLPLFAPFNKKYIFIRNKKSSNIGESQKFGWAVQSFQSKDNEVRCRGLPSSGQNIFLIGLTPTSFLFPCFRSLQTTFCITKTIDFCRIQTQIVRVEGERTDH